jgi:cytochrome c
LTGATLWRHDGPSGTIATDFLHCIGDEMKQQLTLLAAGVLVTGSAHAALDNKAAEELMKKDGCAACHAVDKKVIGPAYQDVAAKYKGDAKAEAMLVDKIKKGGVGVWGQIPMPPNAQVPEADIKNLVSWILTLKK